MYLFSYSAGQKEHSQLYCRPTYFNDICRHTARQPHSVNQQSFILHCVSKNWGTHCMPHNGYRTLRPQDTSDPHETLRHRCRSVFQDTSAPKTRFETLRHWYRSVLRHFGIKSRKNGTLRHAPRQFGRDTSALVPKCLKEKSGHFGTRTNGTRHFGTGVLSLRHFGTGS